MISFSLFACGKRSAHLKWEDTSDDEEGFRIYRVTPKGKSKLGEVGANVTNYVDKDSMREGCYLVTAFNAAGESSPSNAACLKN
jgi:hypothetical protein